ncbi:MAG: hypothetical protein WBW16_11155 [Bacteroidota bacterium]
MKCFRCGGTGRVTIDDTGLGWPLKEGRCPTCRGLGEVPISKQAGCIFPTLVIVAVASLLIIVIGYVLTR